MKRPFIMRALSVDHSGASAAEFVLIVPVIVLVITATIDFGGLIFTRLQVASAAHAGASFAAANGFNQDEIAAAVAGGASIDVVAEPPVRACGCPDAEGGVVAETCGEECPSGGAAGNYVTVAANTSYPLTYSWPGLSNPVQVRSTAQVRIP